MRVIKILGGALVAASLFACGTRESAPATYAELMGLDAKRALVMVSSFARTAGDVRRSYMLVPASSSGSVRDLEFREYSRYLQKLLDARGYHPAASLAEAELLISFDYRVEGPVERVTVDRHHRGWRTDDLAPNYTRRALVRACDAAQYRKDGQLHEVWVTQLVSTGKLSDLRVFMPVILLAAWDLYGVDSHEASPRSVDINGPGVQWLRSEDRRAMEARR